MSEPAGIRAAVAEDAAAIAALAARTFALACPPGTTQDDIDAFIAANLTADHFRAYLGEAESRVWVATMGDALVAYALAQRARLASDVTLDDPAQGKQWFVAAFLDEPKAPPVFLSKFYVDQGHHGAGLAGRLIEQVLHWATATGAPGIWLGVNEHNHRAVKFYGKHGLQRVGTRTFVVGTELHHDFVLARPS